MSIPGPLISIRTLSALPCQCSSQLTDSGLEMKFVACVPHPLWHGNTNLSLQTLHNWLLKRSGGPPLPPGSSLVAIFDSCNTLLGNLSSLHDRHLLLLTPRKTLTIISATMCIARGSTREDAGAKPSETASVSCHRASITCRRSLLYPFVQLGGATNVLVPQADSVPQTGTGVTREPSSSPAFSNLYGRWR